MSVAMPEPSMPSRLNRRPPTGDLDDPAPGGGLVFPAVPGHGGTQIGYELPEELLQLVLIDFHQVLREGTAVFRRQGNRVPRRGGQPVRHT